MEFGRVENLDEVDFSFKDDHSDTDKLLNGLKKTKKKDQKIYVGCAKWGRKEWVRKIYPPKTKAADYLHYYLKQFNCLELNATFYGIPSGDQIKKWKSEAPEDFKFCPKFPQIISHYRRLKNTESLTKEFLKAVSHFDTNLGACFLQLHQNFSPANLNVLEDYLKKLPKDITVNVEFRHPGWFEDTPEANKAFEMMKDSGIGTVITDTAGRRDVLHQRLISPVAFIRYVGNSLHKSDYKRIDDWVERIHKWYGKGIKTVYFMMHMHDEAYSPELALYTIRELNEKIGLDIKEPEFYK